MMEMKRTKPIVVDLDAHAIGRRIRAARKSRGWKAKTLAEVTGLALGTITAFESGCRLPSRDSAIRLAVALNHRLDWLLLGKGIRKTRTGVGRRRS